MNMVFDKNKKHILKIYDKNDNEIKFSTIDLIIEKRSHSSNESKIVLLDNKKLNSYEMKTFKVLYKCRCKREHKILLCRFLGKQKIVCKNCIQDRSFDDYLIAYSKKDDRKKSIYGIRDKQQKLSFNEMSDEYKLNYKNNHFSEEEFFKYIPVIKKINDIDISANDKINFYYAKPTNNQFKFSSLISINGNKEIPLKSFSLQCSICKKLFNIHPLDIRKKDILNLICNSCNFSNFEYKIKLFDSTGLTYQSKPEKKFIECCLKNNIKIVNGLEIPYIWNNHCKTYISDFYLPDYKMIIEIKDDNHFYRNDLKNGKIEAKKIAAEEFGKKENIEYRMIFSYEIDDFIKSLIDKNLNV